MCFAPKIPQIQPTPTPPAYDSDAVRLRQQQEQQRLLASSGSAGTVKTDLSTPDIVGQKRVLLGV